MRRRTVTLAATTLVVAIVAVWAFSIRRSGSDGSLTAADADEQVILDSPVLKRLVGDAHIARLETSLTDGCNLGVTVVLSRRVHIRAGGITATATDGQCHVMQSATFFLDATSVPSIYVALDRHKHVILYIRPNWDVAGADVRSARWEGKGLRFPPVGD